MHPSKPKDFFKFTIILMISSLFYGSVLANIKTSLFQGGNPHVPFIFQIVKFSN